TFDLNGPSRATSDSAELDLIAAAARADHSDAPDVLAFPEKVDRAGSKNLRRLFYADRHERCRASPKQALDPRPQTIDPAHGPSIPPRAGIPRNGVMSPRPTIRRSG